MSSQQSAQAMGRAAQSRLQELGSRLAAIEARVASQDSIISNHTNQLQSLETERGTTHHFARMTAAELTAHVKRMDYHESLIRAAHDDGNLSLPSGVLEDNVDLVGENDAQPEGGGAEAIPLSVDESELQKEPALKTVVIETFRRLCGIPHLHDYASLVYPAVPETDPAWPGTTNSRGERSPYMRFNFDEPYDEPRNWKCMQFWANHILEHGATITPAFRELLPRLSLEQILTACRLRFAYIRKQFRRSVKPPMPGVEQNPPLPNTQLGNNPDGQAVPDSTIDPTLLGPQGAGIGPGEPPATPSRDIRSRAVGKSERRIRQREKLTGDNKKYQDPKYNGGFKPGAMSDDEDKYSLIDGVWVKVKDVFVSRERSYISEEMRQLRNAVDAVPDPNEKARPVRRERGEPKSEAPKKWEKDNWAMEEWMIDAGALTLHSEWLDTGLVLKNGPEWGGDGEQVVRRPTKRGRTSTSGRGRAGVAGPGPSTTRALQARRALQEAQQHAREVQGEDSLDSFTMNLD